MIEFFVKDGKRVLSNHISEISALIEVLKLLQEQKFSDLIVTKANVIKANRSVPTPIDPELNIQESVIWSMYHGENDLKQIITPTAITVQLTFSEDDIGTLKNHYVIKSEEDVKRIIKAIVDEHLLNL